MSRGIKLLVFPVKDLAAAKPVFAALLGVEPYVDSAYYVGYRVGEQEIGLDPNGHAHGLTGPIGYVQVDDIEQGLARLIEAGATMKQAVKDVGGGKRTAWVTDASGNVLGLMQ